MTQDIAHVMNEDGLFVWDWNEKVGDLNTVDGLETACLVSLFTNARLEESVAQIPMSRSGWIGNIRTAKEPRQLGCKLWSLENARLTTYLLTQRKEACTRAFDWMLKDRIVRNVSAESSYNYDNVSDKVELTSRDGSKYEAVYLWRKTHAFAHSANFNTRG